MIRHSTNRWYHGKRVAPGDPVEASKKSKEVLMECGQAYDDGQEAKPVEELSVENLKTKVSNITDVDVLNEWLKVEKNNKNRVTAIEYIENRIDEL